MNTMKPSSGGSFGAHVWGFFAGIASALAFMQIFGGGWFGLLLAYCCLIPLYMAGMGGGRGPIVTATLFGILGVALQSLSGAPGVTATIYALMIAVPTMVVCRIALIPTGIDGGDDKHMGSSALLFTYLTLGILQVLAVGGLLSLNNINLTELSTTLADQYGATMTELNPNLPQDKVDATVAFMANGLVSLTAMSWLALHVFSFIVGLWLMREAGLAKRAAPTVSSLELPGYLVFALIAAAAASYLLDTNLGMIIGAIATLLGTGFTLVGLAIFHAMIIELAARNNWGRGLRGTVLLIYYVVALGLQLPLLFALLVGLADPWLKFRKKFVKTNPVH